MLLDSSRLGHPPERRSNQTLSISIFLVGLSVPYSSSFLSGFWLLQFFGSMQMVVSLGPFVSEFLRLVPEDIHGR